MLSNQENIELIRLLNKVEWPVSPGLFDAICGNMTTSPVDLAILKKSTSGFEVFLINRKDVFFDGWHIPGSVILPGRTIAMVLKDIVEREINILERGFDFKFITFHQFMKGTNLGQCPRGQETELLFTIFIEENDMIETNEFRKFFPIEELPENVLSHHKTLLLSIRNYLSKIN